MPQISNSEVTLLKNSDWVIVDGEVLRVLDFSPMATVKDGKIIAINSAAPYASVKLESVKMPNIITGFITHKTDFLHLWKAFKERGVKEDEEVIIFWTSNNYKNFIYRLLSFMLPKVWVIICRKETFESMTDPGWKPELKGEARFKLEKPLAEWKPSVMV